MKIILFLPKNNPNALREARIDQWSGRAICIPRYSLGDGLSGRKELDGPCIYFLIGPAEKQRIPRVYVGEADGFRDRVKNHDSKKDWWQTVVAFYSSDGSLTKAGIQYLESVCVERLRNSGWCTVDNGNDPRRPSIPREDEEGLELFAKNIGTLLPVLGFDIFSPPPATLEPTEASGTQDDTVSESGVAGTRDFDTLVCPAQDEGFRRAFLEQRAWWAVRINEQNIPRIKYVAIYQVAPVSAITYYGEVAKIEPFEGSGKYKLFLKGEPVRLDRPIGIGKNRHIKPQGPKYARIEAIRSAASLDDVFPG